MSIRTGLAVVAGALAVWGAVALVAGLSGSNGGTDTSPTFGVVFGAVLIVLALALAVTAVRRR